MPDAEIARADARYEVDGIIVPIFLSPPVDLDGIFGEVREWLEDWLEAGRPTRGTIVVEVTLLDA